jgi:serine/threonine protein kinase
VQRKPKWWVKLGDFGLSKKQTDETVYRTQAGTEKYMAPELYCYVPALSSETSEYTNAVDIWALGCVVYRIITRAVPFSSLRSLYNYSICKEELLFKIPSPMAEAEAFVRNLLAPHPAERLTASAALEHSWVITSKWYLSLATFEVLLGRC